jgi:hypothetical protein
MEEENEHVRQSDMMTKRKELTNIMANYIQT